MSVVRSSNNLSPPIFSEDQLNANDEKNVTDKNSETNLDQTDLGRPSQVNFVSANTLGHVAELEEASKYEVDLKAAATESGLDVSLICAVVSRESGWGLVLKPPGPGGTGDWKQRNPKRWRYAMPPDKLGWGRGLMQIDYQTDFAKTESWKIPRENLLYGCNLLTSEIKFFDLYKSNNKFDRIRAGISAYNCGRANVIKAILGGHDVDIFTAHQNYSSDVLKRQEWFEGSMSA